MPALGAQPGFSTNPSGFFSSNTKKLAVLALLLIAATLALYNPANRALFTNYDDQNYITENYHVHQGLTWQNVKWAFTTFEVTNWHPVTWLSYLLDAQLYRLNPAGYHFTNIALHSLNVALLFLVLAVATGRLWPSFWVAAIFAVHPLNVESVAWIAERKNVLSTFFLLVTLAAYGWYASKASLKRYAVVLAAFAMGLMAKPMLVTLPFALLLLDYWPLQRFAFVPADSEQDKAKKPLNALLTEKIPLLILAVASSVLTVLAQHQAGAIRTIQVLSFSRRIENALLSYGKYLVKAFWPTRLAVFYPYDAHALRPGPLLLSSVVVIGLTTAALMLRRSKPYFLIGWLWYLGTMVPVIGLVQVGDQAMADRYAYVPLIGIYVALVWMICEFAATRGEVARAAGIAGVVALLLLAVVTRRQISYWHDSIALFTHSLEVTPTNWLAQDNLGHALSDAGRDDEAVKHYFAALATTVHDPLAHYDLGTYFLSKHQLRDAVSEYESTLQVADNPQLLAKTNHNMGVALAELGDAKLSEEHFRAALRLDPQRNTTYTALGMLLLNQGRPNEAIEMLSKSVAIAPTAMAYYNLGRSYQREGLLPEAVAAYREVLREEPDSVEAKRNIEVILQSHPDTAGEQGNGGSER